MRSTRIKIIDQSQLIDEDLRNRLSKLTKSFRERTNTDPNFIVRASGRINLIGDHIDYHGFSVLPMAIENSIWLSCSFDRSNNDTKSLRLYNNQKKSYPDFIGTHSLDYGYSLDEAHKWHHYILCGYHGIMLKNFYNIDAGDALQYTKSNLAPTADRENGVLSHSEDYSNLSDLNVLIESNLPPASGLSSSSALVCASAIATHLYLQSIKQEDLETNIDSQVFAEDCAKFEHLIGTHGGGMDQAVIMTANKGYAKHVSFMPGLSCEDVKLPSDLVWLVSHCGSDYAKAATTGFNTRVLETKLGAAMIVSKLGSSDKAITMNKSITLGGVKEQLFAGSAGEEIVAIIREKVLPHETVSLGEVCSTLGMSEEELYTNFGTSKEFVEQNLDINHLKLRIRCEHVFEEADRVQKFKEICCSSKDARLLGQLMTESHYSLRDKYESSCDALDKLVDLSLQAGALGARLTGAGWGGCIVTLVESTKCDAIHSELSKSSKFTFRTEPQSGCQIIKLQ